MRNKKRRIKKDKTQLDNHGISIDLHGYRYRDAELIILEHIDEVYYSNLHYVRVIHGHGEGTLKSLVRKIMRESKKIKSYQAVEGDAVTIGEVEFYQPN
tara:strand:- start:36 stop:332 length:297 start_codon:yes stop_codon:yes gene_type:complete